MKTAAKSSRRSTGKTAVKKTSAKKTTTSRTQAAPTKKAAPAKKTAAKKSTSKSSDDRTMLEELFIDGIKDIYWAEKHLIKALGKMQKAATSEELRQAFVDHQAVTEEQVSRLEEVFEIMGQKAQGKKCDAMAGLVEEGNSIIEETEKGTATRDVGLILAAQKIEHYEIASYGGLAQVARTLGYDDAAMILETTLEEEKETDVLLTQIAENNINVEASQEDEEDEDMEEDEEDEE